MAFTSRAPRGLGAAAPPSGGAGPSAPGPGAYGSEVVEGWSRRVNAVPFGSSSARPLGPDEGTSTPGPGAYAGPAVRSLASARLAASSAFRSRTARAPLSRASDTPGPGQYDVKQAWGGRKPARRARARRAPAARAGAQPVPSIPAGPRSFGYDELEDGRLVPQGPPRPGHTGREGDQAGPGEYDVRPPPPSGPGAPSWGRSKARRTSIGGGGGTAEGTPGPGAYDAPSSIRAPRSARGSAAFRSASSRWKGPGSAAAAGTPGPGAYDTASAGARRPEGSAIQCFGSTQSRLARPPRRGVEPGPGAYFQTQPFLGAAAREQFTPDDEAARAPFQSTAPRFAAVGGAGAGGNADFYLDPSRDVAPAARFGRNTSFGTTSRRFDDAEARANAWKPGPGAHARVMSAGPAAGRAPGRHTSSFASRTTRFRAPRRAQGPAPGTYDAAPSWHARSHGRRGILASGESRFAEFEAASMRADEPGPGAYSGEAGGGGGGGGGGAVSAFRSAAPRLERPRLGGAGAPGPGAYEVGARSLVRPSFNVTIGAAADDQ